MNADLSPIAWIALGGILIFVVLLNVSLITAIKNRNKNSPNILHKAANSIRDPWKNENDQLDELSKRVEKFKVKPTQDNENQG